jgi:tRNA(Ile)-lysidine synthase
LERVAVNAVEAHLHAHGPGPGPHVVAYSGGLDSAVLLDLLFTLAPRFGMQLEAVTIDHGLRDFHREAAVSAQFCARLGIPHTVIALSPGVLERSRCQGQSLMACTREERYRALSGAASGGTIYVAHHADDQAETLLLRLLRGSGLTGLAGMREVAGSLRRPLLSLPRGALRAYAESRGIPVVEDPSNENTQFVRNHLRHVVVPLLPTDTGNPTLALARSAGLLAEQADVLDDVLESLMGRHAEVRGSTWTLTGWGELAPRVRKALVHRLLSTVCGQPACYKHAEAVNQLLSSPHGTVSLDLGAGLVARREYDVLTVGPTSNPESTLPRRVADEGSLPWGEWRFCLSHVEAPAMLATTHAHEAWFGPQLARPLTIRGWCVGDRMRPYGMTGTRLLSDLLGEAGIPRDEREFWPVVLDADERILWVPGVRRSGHMPAVAGEKSWQLTCSPRRA